MLKKINITHSNETSINHFLITILFFLSLISTEILAQSKAAKVIILRGSAQYTAKDGTKVTIKRGDWLPEGAIVKTEAKSFSSNVTNHIQLKSKIDNNHAGSAMQQKRW